MAETTTRTRYCLGFVLSETEKHVLLLRKAPGSINAGRWNGVGWLVEPDELYREQDAMQREAREETGLDIPSTAWRWIGRVSGGDRWTMSVWTAHASIATLLDARNPDPTEPVSVFTMYEVLAFRRSDLVPNLAWLLGACLDPDRPLFDVTYR